MRDEIMRTAQSAGISTAPLARPTARSAAFIFHHSSFIIDFCGAKIPCKALTLAEIKEAAKTGFDSLPKWLASMISGRIGAFFTARAMRKMPMRLLCRLHDALVRAQYGALLECPAGWRERLALGTDTRTPFGLLCDAEAKERLADNERSRLEYAVALLTSCVCNVLGGKAKATDFLLPEGSFGKPEEKALPPDEQLREFAAAQGATVIDRRPAAINQL